jgi:hypothetical protein
MAQRFEDIVIPQRTEECLVEVTCDICKRRADRPGGGQWDAPSAYTVSETSVSCEEGDASPEGGNIESLSFDICPTCFKEKLIPFFALFGAKPHSSED